ncbi:MAG: Na+/H+ antiporter subunit D, partial [Pseudomonadota bacterium]
MLLATPILLPLGTAILCFLLRRHRIHRTLSTASALVLVIVGIVILGRTLTDGPQAVQMGGWAAPYGITLAADILSGVMVTIAGIAAFTALVYATV